MFKVILLSKTEGVFHLDNIKVFKVSSVSVNPFRLPICLGVESEIKTRLYCKD